MLEDKSEAAELSWYYAHMQDERDIIGHVRRAAARKMLFLPHAVQQMLRPDRMIRRMDVRLVIEQGELIEDYPSDPRGHSCLLAGAGVGGRQIHVVCSPKDDYLAVITAYLPDEHEWSVDFRRRIKI